MYVLQRSVDVSGIFSWTMYIFLICATSISDNTNIAYVHINTMPFLNCFISIAVIACVLPSYLLFFILFIDALSIIATHFSAAIL